MTMEEETRVAPEETLTPDQLSRFILNFISISYNSDSCSTSVSHAQSNFDDVLEAFITNLNPGALYVVKHSTGGFKILDDINVNSLEEPESIKNITAIIILIKSKNKLTSHLPLTKQLNIINLPISAEDGVLDSEDNSNESFEKLRLAINLGLAPFFNLVSQSANEESSLTTTKKKFNELSLSLQHLQQRIHIPNLLITTHTKIKSLDQSNFDETFESLLQDTTFLNEVTTIVNNWARQIQGLIRLNHDPMDSESIMEEIQFWKSMEAALLSLNQQVSSFEIKKSVEILNKAKRFHITLGFQNDVSSISDKLTQARLYNSLLKELPMNDLITISGEDEQDFSKFELAIVNIFNHLKLKLNSYPLTRSVETIEVILNDIISKFQGLLTKKSIMSLSFSKFSQLYDSHINKLFDIIENNIKYMINLLRELLRRRQEKFKIIKINQTRFDQIKSRLEHLYQFRLNHLDLLQSIENVLSNSDKIEASMKLSDAYNKEIISINSVDISYQGSLVWKMREESYLEVFNQLNTLIVKRINLFFAKASTFVDAMAIYTKFFFTHSSSLLVSINDEYKLKILSIADVEIQKLIDFNSDRKSSDDIVGQIMWNSSLVSKLSFYRNNLKTLLGINWNNYSTGTKIDATTNKIIVSLNPQLVYNRWIVAIGQKHAMVENLGKIIDIVEKSSGNDFDLIVNFNYSLLQIYEQLIQLSNLGLDVPSTTLMQYGKIYQLHPLAIGLRDHVNLLCQLFENMQNSKYGQTFGFLLSGQIGKVKESLKPVLSVEWIHLSQAIELQKLNEPILTRSENLIEIQSLAKLNQFQESIIQLNSQSKKLENLYDFMNDCKYQLKTCDFDFKNLESQIKLIQEQFQSISLEEIENIEWLVDLLNKDIESVLSQRLYTQLFIFNKETLGISSGDESEIEILELDKYNLQKVDTFQHWLEFHDESFVIIPSLEQGKENAFGIVNGITSIVESQHSVKPISGISKNFNGIISRDEDTREELITTFSKIDDLYIEANEYIIKWKNLQILWELNLEDAQDLGKVFNLESTIGEWFPKVKEILKNRELFDQPHPDKSFGNLFIINFSKVQNRVALMFDKFQKELLNQFAKKFSVESNIFNRALSSSIGSLEEAMHFNLNSTKLIVLIDSYLKNKQLFNEWEEQIKLFNQIQNFLFRQRYKFPSGWLYVEQLESHLSMVLTLIQRKQKLIDDNYEIIVSKIKAEAIKLNDSVHALYRKWSTHKPITGNLSPAFAMVELENFQKQFANLELNTKAILNVAVLLDIAIIHIDDLSLGVQEVKDLKIVWSSVNGLWEDLERLKHWKWSELQPRQLHVQLAELLNSSRSLPTNVRQYAAVDEIQNLVKDHLKNHNKVAELKNECMKERHWKILLSQLGVEKVLFEEMTVGDVWNLNISLNLQVINEMLEQANNERTIEENLTKINTEWSTITFELFNYENKCRLVKNWDKLFDQCNNDINALSSMKNSPYFGSFEREISELEKKLNNLFMILDTWIDVQRQWVYLDGVFGNSNNDIKSLLPIETTRFTNITYELQNLMKRIYKFNLVIDIVLIGDIQTIMNKFLESLTKVRRLLTDYLEKQRELFPRFYFVGNEDLLEIIGGSNDITRINRHFKKMFAGIECVEYANESSSIVSVQSEEGEKLELNKPVSLIKFPRLNEWLNELELETRLTLAQLVKDKLGLCHMLLSQFGDSSRYLDFVTSAPGQVALLAVQITFTTLTEESMKTGSLNDQQINVNSGINALTQLISYEISDIERKKIQNLIIEMIHHRDIITSLLNAKSESERDSIWHISQKFYFDTKCSDLLSSLKVKQVNAEFNYAFEYLGVVERLAYTPLIDNCFLTMTQALARKQGGSPFGPAGTGKTESIKALGHNLGKMVLVFCCDESFDFQSMGRIFLGLCRVGIWGCFDEFNRLDDGSLSAISSQIETIEHGLKNPGSQISISNRSINVDPETGLFVTMNPGYVGRQELPENLKKLFRSFSMEKPDSTIIVEILLASQAFENSRDLANVIVPFYLELAEKVSRQSHYDFGLRALKSMLIRCGQSKRNSRNQLGKDQKLWETELVLRSIIETILPKLVREDEILFNILKDKFFAGVSSDTVDNAKLVAELHKYCSSIGIQCDDRWITKASQVVDIQNTHHGIMLVGESGSGKSTILNSVLHALSEVENVEHTSIVIDAKVLSKEQIYGKLDLVTRDWTDGLFTSVLRRIRENLRGELSKRIWIVFDCDIDPQWAENLNSVLDDNRILTLPNGERLALPDNLRIVFEVDSLKCTTPATVSRCGMVWFDSSLISIDALCHKLVHNLNSETVHLGEEGIAELNNGKKLQTLFVQQVAEILNPQLLSKICDLAKNIDHIMDFSIQRAVTSFETTLRSYLRRFIKHSYTHNSDIIDIKKYVDKAVLLSFIWTFAGDASYEEKEKFGREVALLDTFGHIEPVEGVHLDYDISLPECEWLNWNNSVFAIELEPYQVASPNTVVPTLDTVRHEYLVYSILNEHRPLLLCGPPGSGKTMTLLEALRKSPQLDVLSLNFSKDTSPISLLKSLEQFCEYKKSNRGIQLAPKVSGKWVVVFCDEINLPKMDKYGTQQVISLIRLMVEHKGFWRTGDQQWVSLENIQFVGACNSPKDPGRNALSERFLRHVSLIMVDYPGTTSLKQIYHTFSYAILKCAPVLRGFSQAITDASIEIYQQSKRHFTKSEQPHYIYSPRELTRWSRGLLEALKSMEYTDLMQLIRVWYHEGLRLFYDRLVSEKDRNWTMSLFRQISGIHFLNVDLESCFKAPVLFSNWLTLNYRSVNENELKSFLSERLRVFSEEETEVDLVLHEDMLDHALRIDRVLRQPQGHMILVGPSTSGKSTLAKFVAWINGLKIVQLNVRRNYSIDDFDNTLRKLLLRCVGGERVCFIIDESSILETSFIERMNTLLANAEIPGLFEGEEYTSLMSLCLEISNSQGLLLDNDDELYNWFRGQVSQNLHVIFTISETNVGSSAAVISSPALFNRCVLSWMGDWSNKCLYEIAASRIEQVPLDISNYSIPTSFEPFLEINISNFRDVLVDAIAFIHRYEPNYQATLAYRRAPSDFLNFISGFVTLFNKKQFELEESQRHISGGLDKLRETVIKVDKLKTELARKQEVLKLKDKDAKVMLNKMLTDQNEAERKQEFSVATQAELEKQEIEIERRRNIVMKDLALVEPAVLEAQRGVQNIKKQYLTEIRSMSNPPAAVKMTMESVCALLGYEVSTWRDVQLVIRKDDFIPNIVSFDNETQITPELRKYMEEMYVSREDFTYEVAYRASKACGPLLQWVLAQLTYSRILQTIAPLREEVQRLETQTKKTKTQLIVIDEMIHELEESIEKYKDDYSELIRETENIKTEMKTVEKKVERSLSLLNSLTNERERWKGSIKRFADQRERLIGNSLLVAGFLAYCGIYDQKGRQLLVQAWKNKLNKSGIVYDEELTVSQYLTNANESLKWVNSGLLNDELNIDNFSLLKWSQTPLIIDPTSSIVEILVRSYSPKTVTVTSFLHDGLIHQLENALRFGGLIVIEECQYYDPILDPILRGEIHKQGGRLMARLGEQMVDFSPNFRMILSTKDGHIKLPAFVSSRTNIVNFTVTIGSLETRALDIALRVAKPDIEKQREELISLNGEYHARLQTLEEELLNSLSDSIGNILDNDKLVETLETLKAESSLISEKLSHAKEIILNVEEARNQYQEVAKHASIIYSVLELLGGISSFYNVSLSRFISLFAELLGNNHDVNLSGFVLKLYEESFAKVAPSLKLKDKIILALMLSIVYYSEDIGTIFKGVFLSVLKSIYSNTFPDTIKHAFGLCLARVESGSDNVGKILENNQDNSTLKVLSSLILAGDGNKKAEIINTFSSITSFLYSGDRPPYSSPYELNYWISREGITTFILTCPDGFDATYKVEKLAMDMKKKLTIVSMGSKEGVDAANSEIQKAANNGDWLVVQNIQMSPAWLSHLEMRLNSINFHKDTRLLLTCGTSSHVPSGLISQSRVLHFDTELGLTGIVQDTFKSIPVNLLEQQPVEMKSVLLLLVWYHSIIIKRLRYCPASFKKSYDINDSDFATGLYVIQEAFAPLSKRTNVDPKLIPWDTICYLIGTITYGGKVDDKDDFAYFESLASRLFSEKAFEIDFNIIENEYTIQSNSILRMPEGNSISAYTEWIAKLPNNTPLSWIGLDENDGNLVQEKLGEDIASKVVEISERV
ncbi:cytoplasmic dynein heavy chain [Spathaspora passalidarum NRRL Y-27907]|uniref:Dynein heavy chain, cytoplasmic n=1 Tax=Spathaspora passalidarum (strain NRRL Y-27907 / 11-Y1) TaxID=619300 RepID=G3AQ39_SPAPN|nr:cytoplasmic dynein heavy chain [Spathaspora passalidarum NRRL Y-27907]EGW31386.1 cytoplasmic dynein heavy chain [Spathaspora passalidarum NRRL Y-27907]